MKIKLEITEWCFTNTEKEYPEGSLVYTKSLGGGFYGMVIFTPNGEFHLEEFSRGFKPGYYGKVKSLQEALEVMESWT